MRDRLAYVKDGKGGFGRPVFARPPKANAGRDPDAPDKASNDALGIEQKALLAPFVMVPPEEIAAVATQMISDKTLHMPNEDENGYELEGCAWNTLDTVPSLYGRCRISLHLI